MNYSHYPPPSSTPHTPHHITKHHVLEPNLVKMQEGVEGWRASIAENKKLGEREMMCWGCGGAGVGGGGECLLDNSSSFLPNHVGEFVKQEIAV